jgi:hypothetical protein
MHSQDKEERTHIDLPCATSLQTEVHSADVQSLNTVTAGCSGEYDPSSNATGAEPSQQMPQLPNQAPNQHDLSSFEYDTGSYELGPWFDSSLGDFLADVMMPLTSPSGPGQSNASAGIPTTDLLDLGVDHGLDFDVFDFALFDTQSTLPTQSQQPGILEDMSEPPSRMDGGAGHAIDVRASEAFRKSLWRWLPKHSDAGHCEQLHLSLPADAGVTPSHTKRPCEERLGQSTRDKIMAIAMATCDQSQILHIVSRFPSADVLDCLVQDDLFYLRTRSVTHIHIPTFSPNDWRPELVAMIAAHGAIRNEVAAIRRLGYALQEAVRLSLINKAS